jgi:hypothetical protein
MNSRTAISCIDSTSKTVFLQLFPSTTWLEVTLNIFNEADIAIDMKDLVMHHLETNADDAVDEVKKKELIKLSETVLTVTKVSRNKASSKKSNYSVIPVDTTYEPDPLKWTYVLKTGDHILAYYVHATGSYESPDPGIIGSVTRLPTGKRGTTI